MQVPIGNSMANEVMHMQMSWLLTVDDKFFIAPPLTRALLLLDGISFTDGPTIVVINLMFRSFPTISDNKMVRIYLYSLFKLCSLVYPAWHIFHVNAT